MTICFVEDKYTLFTEACLRGWLAAVLDFPKCMDRKACELAAQSIPDDLRPEVCCIGEDEYAYKHLIIIAWFHYYMSTEPCSERELAVAKSVLASMPIDEALQFLRDAASREAQTVISDTYTQYCLCAPSPR